MKVEIDNRSGFCFGVTRAIKTVEETLAKGGFLYCLGDIVHNSEEVGRLEAMGLITIGYSKYFSLKNCTVLLRAHGEPPSTYDYARENNIELIDATCPIVMTLQKRIRQAYQNMLEEQGQVIIYGKKDHAETTGLAGQTGNQAIIVENENDLDLVDRNKPSVLFSQTTKSPADFKRIADLLKSRSTEKTEVNDTICRQVSNRGPILKEFAARFDVIIFVGGEKSSNARYLFEICSRANAKSHFVSLPAGLVKNWFTGCESVGVCGATSTPQWLLEEVAARIRQF